MAPDSPVGLLVIATGRYLEYAERLAEDVDRLLDARRPVVLNLLTDRVDEAQAWSTGLRRLGVNVLPVPAWRWPEASLLRYRLFLDLWPRLQGDVLIYLDADLRATAPFVEPMVAAAGRHGLVAVHHPGFFRPGWRPRRKVLGSWETSPESAAFVPEERRRTYVCGGVWLGMRDRVEELCRELDGRVARDRAAGVTAVWHDESHWNWYVAGHRVGRLSPSYCYVPDYPWLSRLPSVIAAVDKGPDFVREATPPDVVASDVR